MGRRSLSYESGSSGSIPTLEYSCQFPGKVVRIAHCCFLFNAVSASRAM